MYSSLNGAENIKYWAKAGQDYRISMIDKIYPVHPENPV